MSGKCWYLRLKSPLYRNHRRTTLQTENANGVQQPMTVVTLSKLITPQAMQQCLQFIYTGSLDKRYHDLQVRWVDRNYRKRKGILENVRSLPFSFFIWRGSCERVRKSKAGAIFGGTTKSRCTRRLMTYDRHSSTELLYSFRFECCLWLRRLSCCSCCYVELILEWNFREFYIRIFIFEIRKRNRLRALRVCINYTAHVHIYDLLLRAWVKFVTIAEYTVTNAALFFQTAPIGLLLVSTKRNAFWKIWQSHQYIRTRLHAHARTHIVASLI